MATDKAPPESGEDRLIARYFRPLARHPGALGLLDDAAVLTPPPGSDLVLTTDVVLGGVHFFADDPPNSIARKALPAGQEAEKFGTTSARNTEAWKTWRKSPQYQKWNQAIAPLVVARRRTLQLLGSKEAVQVLFAEVAPRFVDRPGGYTRVLRLAKPRLGDAGTRAILEFVGVRDRAKQRSVKPSFEASAS